MNTLCVRSTHVLLVAAAALSVAASAEAQQIGYPITGFYIGAAGGVNLKGNEAIKNLSSNLRPLSSGVSTPNLSVGLNAGGMGLGTIGYGLGNGLRLEAEFDYRANTFNNVSRSAGFGASASASGHEQTYGPMFNVVYDFVNVTPWVVPYVGVGLGYQRAHLSNFLVAGPGTAAALSPALSSNDTRDSFAAQGIIGAAFPIPQVLGLSLTAEYRIMGMTGTRTYDAGLTTRLPTGGTTSRFGTMQWGKEYNNSFVFGLRYNFGVTPPAPPPAPIAAPAPAPARSYLVFFDWDKATLTDRARQIIREAADTSTHVQYTRIEVNGYTDTSGTPQYNMGPIDSARQRGRRRACSGRGAEGSHIDPGLWGDASSRADRSGRTGAAEPPRGDHHSLGSACEYNVQAVCFPLLHDVRPDRRHNNAASFLGKKTVMTGKLAILRLWASQPQPVSVDGHEQPQKPAKPGGDSDRHVATFRSSDKTAVPQHADAYPATYPRTQLLAIAVRERGQRRRCRAVRVRG